MILQNNNVGVNIYENHFDNEMHELSDDYYSDVDEELVENDLDDNISLLIEEQKYDPRARTHI